ncbi:MAG: exodeoxyribonuclease VII small subunit [Planctomycetaceae bacterium]|nr:exodeoxyribonuclease VII small subunit [Planctomycetaceae bacterium]
MAQQDQESAADAPSFEAALAQLQKIVGDLEHGNIGLEESMQQFEQGIQLLRSCHALLESAEQRIEILTGTRADGSPISESFDATATAEEPKPKRKRSRKKPPEDDDAEVEGETLF